MKRISLLIIICLALSSCSKPAEPEVAPEEKVATRTNYILNVRRDSHKPKVVPEGLKVIVLDAETDQVITNAYVKLEWYDKFMRSLNAINMHDGSYIICTNNFTKYASVVATAKGYLSQSPNKSKYPLTIKLKRGETVKVFGKIFDQKGIGVPNARLNLNPMGSMETARRQTLALCSTTSDSEGNYEIATLPIGFEDLYIELRHLDYPRIVFTNDLLNSCNGNVELDLYLPELLYLKGQVKTDDGKPVDKARVVAFEQSSSKIDTLLRQRKYPDSTSFYGCDTLTDSNGFFNLKVPVNQPFYLIKATTKMYQPALAGIFTPNNPPPDFIELVFKTKGSRIVGRMTNQAGLPVTNVTALMEISNSSGHGCDTHLGLDIDEDGNYLSQIIDVGIQNISFCSRDYKRLEKKVVIRKDDMTYVDIVLYEEEKREVKGVVQNPFTKEPISGVILSNLQSYIELEMSPETDAAGEFWIGSNYIKIHFSHPNYVAVEKMFDTVEKSNKYFIIYMSQASALTVNVTGLPANPEKDYYVRLKNKNGSGFVNQQIVNGTTTFTNLPVHFSPVIATLSDARGGTMSISKPVDLVAGETVNVDLIIPDMGKLVIDLVHPFNEKAHYLYGYAPGHKFQLADILKDGKESLVWDSVPANKYYVGFNNNHKKVFETNIIVRAGETTKIFIDYKTNEWAKIFGVTKFEDSTPFRCNISAYSENSKKEKNVRGHTGEFSVSYLDPDLTYTLKVVLNSGCIGSTNLVFENIRPSSEAIELSLGHAYKIYGNVMDADGKPITGVTLNSFKLSPGFFEVYPVLPGKHKIKFAAKGYEPVEKEIIIYGKDQDLGDVYLLK